MSRSYKKAILKDKGYKGFYWKTIRKTINQTVKKFLIENIDDVELPNSKSIINDYDYSDFKIDYEYNRSSKYF